MQALVGAGAADGVFDIIQMDWRSALGIAGFAALTCFAKCLGAALIPPQGSPATLVPDPGGRHRRPE